MSGEPQRTVAFPQKRPTAALYILPLGIALLLAAAYLLLASGHEASAQSSPPAAPTGLSAPSVAHDSVVLSWDDPGDSSITGYQVLRRDIAHQPPGTFSTVVADTGSADTAYTDSTVQPATRYAYRVKAINSAGVSGRSKYVNMKTPETPPSQNVPARPTGLAASSVGHDNVTLGWDDPGDGTITGYQVLRRSRDGEEFGDGEGSPEFVAVADDTGSAWTTYTDTSVTVLTRYVYRVKARNSGGLSLRSSYLNVETSATPAVPAKPTGLAASDIQFDWVTLGWDDPGDSSITHYQVLRREGSSGEFTTIAENTGSAAIFYTDTTVSSDTDYEYRMRAVNGGGPSPESESIGVTTLTAPTTEEIPASTPGPEEEDEEPPPTALQISDDTPPTFVSATTNRNGMEVEVTFNEDIDISPRGMELVNQYLPPVEGYTRTEEEYSNTKEWLVSAVMSVTVDGKTNLLIRATISGPVITLKLESPNVTTGQVVQISYDNVFAQDADGFLADKAGNSVVLFGPQPVTNASVGNDPLEFFDAPVLSKSAMSICAGQTGTYGVSLPTQPSKSVTVRAIYYPLTIWPTPATLTFNQDNWNVPQAVTVHAGSTGGAEEEHTDYNFWGVSAHRASGVPLTQMYDNPMRIIILSEGHPDCSG